METLETQVTRSLDGDSNEIYQYLPYLLQDLWELGSSPDVIVRMVRGHLGDNARALDLGCGKGAVSVRLAAATGCTVKGIDAMKAFIEVARVKADEYGVGDRCRFEAGDIRQSVGRERGYDLVIMGAVGDALGSMEATVRGLKDTVHANGFILIDDAFCEGGKPCDGYLARPEIADIFARNDVELVREEIVGRDTQRADNALNNERIARRAAELKKAFPDRGALFDGYVRRQRDECAILENDVTCAAWLLRKTG